MLEYPDMQKRLRASGLRRYPADVTVKRPKIETSRIDLRVSPERKEAYERAAVAAGQTLSTWIKAMLDRALKRRSG